jgi:prepilin-type N-terminal cleavage/methylation domain-containing protein
MRIRDRLSGGWGDGAMRRSRRGVSFLEILVVLLILSMLMAISIPVMKGTFGRNKLAAAAREIAVLARFARQQAVLRGHDTHLVLEEEENRYYLRLTPEKKNRRGSRSSVRAPKENMEETHDLDASRGRIQFVGIATAYETGRREKEKIVEFHRNGSATPATIVVADEMDRVYTIYVTGATGGVRVEVGAPEEKWFESALRKRKR